MRHARMRGYTLTEILVVIGVIAVLSLVSVPAFINYQQANVLRGAVRQLDGDLRQARMQAITNNLTIRVEFAADNVTYSFYSSSDYGTTWTTYTAPRAFSSIRKLDKPVTVVGNTFRDVNGNGLRDIVFQPNGTLTTDCMAASGPSAVGIGVPWTNVANNRYSIEITAVGQVKDTASHS